MLLDLTEEDVQTVLNCLAEQPAKISYNLITKIGQQHQHYLKSQEADRAMLKQKQAQEAVRREVEAAALPDDHYSQRDVHYP